MSWQKGGEPSEPGEYVVLMGRTTFLMRWNARDRRWFDGIIRRDPHWIRAHFRVPPFGRQERG